MNINFTTNSLKRIFGKNVKYYRFTKKYTQEKLAELVNIDVTFLSDIERGNKGASFELISKLANTLGVKVSDLFDEKILNKHIPNDIRNFYFHD